VQTLFTSTQLANPQTAESEKILRACVHCGFCQATCPTYLLNGDELDSPRGRIYLIKEMLEYDAKPTPGVVKHIDRCLSCLACMTTCPSGVHYMHLVDHARARIETTYERPLPERWLRGLLARVLPERRRLRRWLRLARPFKPLAPLLGMVGLKSLAAMLRLAPIRLPRQLAANDGIFRPDGIPVRRVALLSGCVGPVLSPSIQEATIRVLNRHGVEVIVSEGEGCCGAIAHHLGREREAHDAARRNIEAWTAEYLTSGLEAILATASGCGTMLKDYGFLMRTDPAVAEAGERVSGLALDICEYLARLDLRAPVAPSGLVVAYHSACSLQHGQRITREPKDLLTKLGFIVKDVPEGHLCCGSAGTYNILQPDIAKRLRTRKVGNIEKLAPDVIAAGNIGCITQIAAGTSIPVVHPVELIDWATGGPAPAGLKGKTVTAAAVRASDAAM
jgi:glycolate dehydrogenase iron-sulfur subunit